jgi:hypothetical protein
MIFVVARSSRRFAMKKLIGLLIVLVALMGLTVTELYWGGGEAEADAVGVNDSAQQGAVKTPRTSRRGQRRY